MTKQNIFFQKPFKLFFSFLLIWFVLFEFVLTANGILPKPSSVFGALNDIWNIYNFLPNILFSFGAITFALVLSIFIVYVFRKFILINNLFTELITAVNNLKYFVPVVILSSFIIFWFPDSMYTEYIFLLIVGTVYFAGSVILLNTTVGKEYILAAKSLKIRDDKIKGEILFKQLLPNLEVSYLKLHFVLWTVMLTYEFIQNQWGFGTIIFNSIRFKDMPALFVVTLTVFILISLGYYIIKFIFNRVVHWE